VIPLTDSTPEIDVTRSLAMKQRALGVLSHLPPFPVILNRLMASLTGKDLEFAKLSELIEKDTIISGNILHLVNSALYSRPGTVNSVRHAVSMLGVEKVRNAVLGMSLTRMWGTVRMPKSLSMGRFNIHSSAVAILSDCLAQRVRVSYAEGAFVAGLLHDVGRLLIGLSLPEEHEIIAELHRESGRPVYDCELEILGFSHSELSAKALAFWKLPEPIQAAVLYHHDSEADGSTVGPNEIRLSRVVGVANEYVNSLGISILINDKFVARGDAGLAEGDLELFKSLGLNGDQTRAALAEFNTERDAMAQFFQ
jgi:HD-like signal output (HDOD) protein